MSALVTWWQGRQARERVLLAAGGVALLATLYFLLIVEPLTAREARLNKAIAGEIETQAWLEAQRPRLTTADTSTPRERLPDGASLLAAINESAAASEVSAQLTRVTPAGARGASLSFSEVPYATFMRWLLDLDARYGARVERIRLERAEAPGIVNVDLSLAF